MRGHALVRAQRHAAAIDDHQFTDRFFAPTAPVLRVVEIKQFAGQRELAEVFRREGLGFSIITNTSAPEYMP